MKNIIKTFILCSLMSCNQSTYESVAPVPTLDVALDKSTCAPNDVILARVNITQQGVAFGHSISTIVLAGEATIKLEDQSISVTGDWVEIKSKTIDLHITPAAEGELTISFQVKSPDGTTSKIIKNTLFIKALTPLTLTATHVAKYINPVPQDKFPITISVNKVGSDGLVKIISSITQGKGYFLHKNKVVNDAEIMINNNEVIYYQPAGLGEQILSFEANVDGHIKKIETYIDVVNVVSVSDTFPDCFSISGIGEYNTEGKEITLELINKEKFNFEVAGWYERSTGKLLSSEPAYKLTLTCGSPSDIALKLKPRQVTIKHGKKVSVEFIYFVTENGRPVTKTAYDCRLQLETDTRSADKIFFYYESYYYKPQAVTLQAIKSFTHVSISPATSMTGHFWRIDGNFKIYLRAVDNPTLKFHPESHTIKSASTTYNIPSNIIFQ